jgi:hypothetical protein
MPDVDRWRQDYVWNKRDRHFQGVGGIGGTRVSELDARASVAIIRSGYYCAGRYEKKARGERVSLLYGSKEGLIKRLVLLLSI